MGVPGVEFIFGYGSKMILKDKSFNILAIIIVALLSAAMILEEYILSGGLLPNDGYTYVMFSQQILTHGWRSALQAMPYMGKFPPLLVIFMVIGGKCGASPALVGRLVDIVCILLATQGILFCCLKLYKSRMTALMSALLVSSLPKIYLEGCGVMRDPLFWVEEIWIMCMIMQLADLSVLEKHPLFWRVLLLSGLCGLSVLTRKEGVFLSILVYLVLAFILFRKPSAARTRLLVLLGFPVAVVFIAFLPYCVGVPFVPLNFLFERALQ